jgi:ATP-binding cassette, subfamily B, bacterial
MQGELIRNKIAISMMDRSLSSDLEYFDNPSYYDKYLSSFRDSSAITSIFWNALMSISMLVSFIGVFAVLAQAKVLYSLIMLIAAVPASIASAKYTKGLYGLSLEQINSERQLSYLQSISIDRRYAQDLRLYGAVESLKNRYSRLWAQLFSKRQGITRKRAVLTTLMNFLPEIVVVFIGFDIAFQIIHKTATVGDYALCTGLIGQLWGSISQLSSSVIQILDNHLRIENIKSLDNFQNRVMDNGKKELDQVNSVEFDHVTFSYPGTNKKAINDVSFTLNPGKKTVLVGLNGSGKSTIIKLLLRMYDTDAGIIKINGADIREYSLLSLRSNFSVYFQEMQNYSFSLRENFTIADETRPDCDEAITKSLRESQCEDIAMSASRGLETGLSRFFDPDGLELSGGQYQKLALARAFFRRHTALILDEPSSNLDPKAEHEIFKSLRKFTSGKLTLFTSHRLSNVFLADRILVLEEGRIVEDGTQRELIKNNKRYAELFHYQQEKFLNPVEGNGDGHVDCSD